MSVQALTWSFGVELPDMAAKAALNGLANYADEQGVCWPSIPTLARGAGCSESTMRRAIQRLVDLQLLEREGRAGRSDMYRLLIGENPCHGDTPSKLEPLSTCSEPLSTCKGTPVTVTPHPCQPDTLTVKEPSVNRKGTVNAKPGTLPADWRPTPDDHAFAADLGLEPNAVCESFVDYWTSGKGGRVKRVDWCRTWRVWCRREAQRLPRSPGGIRPSASGGDAGAFARAAARLGGGQHNR